MARPQFLLVAALLGLGACAADDLGTVDLSLTGTSPAGKVYRLREGELLLAGTGTSRVFFTEDDPNRTTITTRLQPGAYTLGLAVGWHLEVLSPSGPPRNVTATLVSTNPLPVVIEPGTLTRVTLLFRVDGEDVPMGDGDLEIGIGIEDRDGGSSPPDAGVPSDAPPPPPDAGPGQAQGDDMFPGEILAPGTSLTSNNGLYSFRFQADGNLALYRVSTGMAIWASGTAGTGASHCIMQHDGNLVLYKPSGVPVWASDTWRWHGSHLLVRNNGSVVIIAPGGSIVWTVPPPPPPP